MAESVSVSAAVEQVQTASGDATRVISDRQLSQIALNGGNYSQLLRLIPGAVATTLDPFGLALSTTGQRINGIRSDSIVFNVDGAENMDNGGNSNAAINPSADAIAEVKILTSGYSAEFGGRSGALVNVVTKSGTQQFHGTLFEFVRNDVFDARTFFARAGGSASLQRLRLYVGRSGLHSQEVEHGEAQALLLRQPGVEVQPHRRHAREHRTRQRKNARATFANQRLPRAVDPLNGAAVPQSVDPGVALFARRAAPADTRFRCRISAVRAATTSATGVSQTEPRELLVRFDYDLSPKTQINYRWVHDEWDILDAFQGGGLGIVPGGRPRPAYVTAIDTSHIFSPTAR